MGRGSVQCLENDLRDKLTGVSPKAGQAGQLCRWGDLYQTEFARSLLQLAGEAETRMKTRAKV